MAGPNLPTNVVAGGTGHVTHTNAAHRILNKFDTANPTAVGQVPVWNGTVYAPGTPFRGSVGVYNVQHYGATSGGTAAQNATAFASACAALNSNGGGMLYFPPGSYAYNGGIVLTSPCTLWGYGATLNYTGSGIAAKLGPDGLVYATRHEKAYNVHGLTFTGGSSMSHGLYFNTFVVTCRVVDCEFAEFGNAGTYGVWFHDENWSAMMIHCRGYVDFANTKHWVRVNAAGGINSTLFAASGCQWNGYGGSSIGIYLNGARNEVAHSKIEGGSPCIVVSPRATGAQLHNLYLESLNNNGCVGYGPDSGVDEVVGLTITGCYFNVHNTDLGYTGRGVYPRTLNSGIRDLSFDGNDMSSLLPTRSPISIHTGVTGQSGNYYGLNTGVTTIPSNPSGQRWRSPTTYLR